jgi:hypothetical protein
MRDAEAAAFLTALPEDTRYETWRLVLHDGSLAGRGQGAVELLRLMRLTRPASRLLGLAPAAALDQLYDMVARRRGLLGRLVPDGRAPRRFP